MHPKPSMHTDGHLSSAAREMNPKPVIDACPTADADRTLTRNAASSSEAAHDTTTRGKGAQRIPLRQENSQE